MDGVLTMHVSKEKAEVLERYTRELACVVPSARDRRLLEDLNTSLQFGLDQLHRHTRGVGARLSVREASRRLMPALRAGNA